MRENISGMRFAWGMFGWTIARAFEEHVAFHRKSCFFIDPMDGVGRIKDAALPRMTGGKEGSTSGRLSRLGNKG